MKTISITIFLIVSLSTFGQEELTFLKNWKSYPVPTDKDTIYKYNSAQNDWFVYLEEDEIRVDDVRNYRRNPRAKLPFQIRQLKNSDMINIAAPLAGLIDAIEVEDGYLVGFNRGEWGGELYWFSKNGKKKYEISRHQIVQFIKRDNKIYAIEGLGHLGISEGSIIEIEKNGKKWIAKELLKLSAPNAVQLDNWDNFIIVTSGISLLSERNGAIIGIPSSFLLSIDRENKVDTLVNGSMWEFLYPSSMVIHKDVVYIGMRKGVYKFDLITKRNEWLLPE
jgi:hypothetical protein